MHVYKLKGELIFYAGILMQKYALVFSLHYRPTLMSIIMIGNVVEVLYNTLCIAKHLFVCSYILKTIH